MYDGIMFTFNIANCYYGYQLFTNLLYKILSIDKIEIAYPRGYTTDDTILYLTVWSSLKCIS